ncbi:MAG: SDR family oxidoreductase [Flavobacteriales bacterium]
MSNKVVVITGASSGIGESLTKEYAKQGYDIVVAARSFDKLESLAKDINNTFSVEVLCVKADVSIESDCANLMKEALNKFGKIDVLINNAGISMRATLEELELDVLRKVMDVNFWGTVYCTKYALPALLKSKGSVIGISSIAGFKGLPGRTGYSSSKFAMQGFLESLRIENRNKGLHVLIACPGFTASNIRNSALAKDGKSQSETPRNEQKMMTSEEVAQRVYTAAKNKKTYCVMTLNGKLTVFLNKISSNLVDKLVFNHMSKEPGSPF